MLLIINGDEREFDNNLKLGDLLQQLELPAQKIAVELNLQVVRRADWNTIDLKNNDKIEIVHFVGGG